MREIAPGVAVIPTLIANAYLLGDDNSWVLVDACTPGNEQRIQHAVRKRLGRTRRPSAILLTHGHFDHAGSAARLADEWGVRIYAHAAEIPYLTGQCHYPPFNLSSPGFFTWIARFFPTTTVNLGSRLEVLRPQEGVPNLSGWEVIETPGHTPGHVAFYRRKDGVLLAGDAVTTMDLDSFLCTVMQYKEVCRPPVPATMNWERARKSVKMLAALHPTVIAAGHGRPMRDAAEELSSLAAHFPIPATAMVRGQEL